MGSSMQKKPSTLEKILVDKLDSYFQKFYAEFKHAGTICANELSGLEVGSISANMMQPGKFTCFLLFPETKTYKVLANTRGYPRDFRSALAVRNFFEKYGHNNLNFQIGMQK